MATEVTIGVPVYNGAATLRRTVESILRQTHPACVVHISDNGSTDATAEVGQALAASHPNVVYTRQPTNLGPTRNFHFLLMQTKTPYFMWLAADDYIEPTYVERMLAVLEADPGLTTCVSRVLFTRPDGGSMLAGGSYPLQADTATNLAAFFTRPADNARVYGLHRTEPLRRAYPASHFVVAWDETLMAATLLYGRHAEVPETLMVRDQTSFQSAMALIRRDARWWLERVFPQLPMTLDLLFRKRIPLRWPVLKALLGRNIDMHFQYTSVYHPRYTAMVRPFLHRHLFWRFWRYEEMPGAE